MHWGLYTCYVQELVAEAATKAVWKALHLVLLKDDKGLLLLQLWDIQWENLAANLDQCLVCQTTYRVKYLWAGMNRQRCIWGCSFGPLRAIQTIQLWRDLSSWQLSILALILTYFVTILPWLTKNSIEIKNGPHFNAGFCWLGQDGRKRERLIQKPKWAVALSSSLPSAFAFIDLSGPSIAANYTRFVWAY